MSGHIKIIKNTTQQSLIYTLYQELQCCVLTVQFTCLNIPNFVTANQLRDRSAATNETSFSTDGQTEKYYGFNNNNIYICF